MRLPTITPKGVPYGKRMEETTLRGFDGGWNASDDDMNLSYKYATQLVNCYPKADGSIAVRDGTRIFAHCADYFSDVGTRIINMEYFNASLIIVGSNGEILRVLADGSVSRIFDAAHAAALSGAPSAWSATDFASFAQFNGHLIICNGIDKPLDVDSDFFVEYLQDAATSTNINVPICKYVVAINRYLVMLGDPLEPDRVHISAKDAPGTWFGDPEPNDGTRLDVGSVLPSATTIRGAMALRGKLVVMFAEGLVFGTLGIYNDEGSHTPNFDDGVVGFGSISHRAGIPYGDDGLFMDLEGVPSLKRTVFSDAFKPDRMSDLIDPEIKAAVQGLSFETLENRVFAVYNKADAQYVLLVPNADTLAETTETIGFVLNYRASTKQQSWCKFTGWNFTCGCRSLQGEVFFGDVDANIWLYDGDEDYCDPTGVPIEYTWEMPWLDFGARTKSKHTKYIGFDTRGASEFTVEMYIDNLLTAPALSMEFSAGEQGQFGDGPQPYGGGRNTSRKKLYAWPMKFQIAKLKITGTSSEGLAFVSISFYYHMAGVRR